MSDEIRKLAAYVLKEGEDALPARERRILANIAERTKISRDFSQDFDEDMTVGQRLADRVAEIGGSWGFIIAFGFFLVVWTVVNTIILATGAFDPYPFVFLNLILSMLAAIQAPVIMMSQNRQAAKDRAAAAHDYEVNLKAEIEIMALHEKLDRIRDEQLTALMTRQVEQINLLSRTTNRKSRSSQSRA
jgi:uncharacterized membrane protein